jgi:hypothetical protein
MQKIPTLFVRDEGDRRHVTSEVAPGCEWVLKGEGVPTRKYDGTCVRLDIDGEWWARREVKPGKKAPPGYVAVSTDDITGKTVGWEPIGQSSFAAFFEQALECAGASSDPLSAGTYELIGPKVNGNPERRERHELVPHADAETITEDGDQGVRSFSGIRDLVLGLAAEGWEGLVYHHPDGRMSKIKGRDFPHG